MHTLREIKLVEAHLGLRRSYANLVAAQYFAALIEAITESGTPVPGEYELFAKALTYLCETDISWRAMERFEQRILALAGIALPWRTFDSAARCFMRCITQVPSLREDLLSSSWYSTAS